MVKRFFSKKPVVPEIGGTFFLTRTTRETKDKQGHNKNTSVVHSHRCLVSSSVEKSASRKSVSHVSGSNTDGPTYRVILSCGF